MGGRGEIRGGGVIPGVKNAFENKPHYSTGKKRLELTRFFKPQNVVKTLKIKMRGLIYNWMYFFTSRWAVN